MASEDGNPDGHRQIVTRSVKRNYTKTTRNYTQTTDENNPTTSSTLSNERIWGHVPTRVRSRNRYRNANDISTTSFVNAHIGAVAPTVPQSRRLASKQPDTSRSVTAHNEAPPILTLRGPEEQTRPAPAHDLRISEFQTVGRELAYPPSAPIRPRANAEPVERPYYAGRPSAFSRNTRSRFDNLRNLQPYDEGPFSSVYNDDENVCEEGAQPGMIMGNVDSREAFEDNNNFSDARPEMDSWNFPPTNRDSRCQLSSETNYLAQNQFGHYSQRQTNATAWSLVRRCGFRLTADNEDIVYEALGLQSDFAPRHMDLIIANRFILVQDAYGRFKPNSYVRFNTGSFRFEARVGDLILRIGNVSYDESGRASFDYVYFMDSMDLFEQTNVGEWERTSQRRIPIAKFALLTPWEWPAQTEYYNVLGNAHSPEVRGRTMESCLLLRRKSFGEHDHDCQKLDWYSSETNEGIRPGDLLLRFGVENMEVLDPSDHVSPDLHACAELYYFTHYVGHTPQWTFEGRDECWVAGDHDLGVANSFAICVPRGSQP